MPAFLAWGWSKQPGPVPFSAKPEALGEVGGGQEEKALDKYL